MRKRTILTTLTTLSLMGLLSACGPAVQPSTNQPEDQSGTSVNLSTWDDILASAERGVSAKMFMVKMDASFAQGSTRTTYSVYGGVNVPDTAYFGIAEANNYVKFYQQGQAAYTYDNGEWSQVSAWKQLNPYVSFAFVIAAAKSHNIPLVQLQKSYVNDEYCDVYRAVIPVDMVQYQPTWLPLPIHGPAGAVVYTFYVGQTSHNLRQVSTISVGSVGGMGAAETDTQTEFFDINQEIAKVQLPKDLIKQLENSQT
ncbi:hypothetical protein GCM10025857_04210 [Alicyclobacillus contaminans]|uniref:hypothetical protein n=1 Tax=Alicyclobacillus contaminans TaxID=392016 RepID=UPI0003F57B23|nr:hypothetical protein [Alicyclobacillus contaminans]GMA49064.1 hypothetical protein GCM10025857_04210 [Alicyclobacillus contaminans]